MQIIARTASLDACMDLVPLIRKFTGLPASYPARQFLAGTRPWLASDLRDVVAYCAVRATDSPCTGRDVLCES